MTITVITLLKRREGMSKSDFIAYYEDHHRRFGERVLSGWATRYVRRYLMPVDGRDEHCDADVVMEIDFPDADARKACFAGLADPELAALIAEDEEKLFDRSRIRTFTVEEHASQLPAGRSAS